MAYTIKSPATGVARSFREFRRRMKRLLLIALPQAGPFFDRRTRNKLLTQLQGFDRINIGCGSNPMAGWLNVGLFADEDLPYGCTASTEDGAALLHFDATKGLPFPDNHLRYVYASHFIEHLEFADGVAFLKMCYKTMQKGGVIRLVLPDFGLWVEKYNRNDMEFFTRYKQSYAILEKVPLKTRGEIFSAQIHGFGHKWSYDLESIRDLMLRAGFLNVSQKKAFESAMPDIEKVDVVDIERSAESIYIEGRKPE